MTPCKRFGHTEGRNKTRQCVVCTRLNDAARYAENPAKAKAKARRYQATELGRAARDRYVNSEKGIITRLKDSIRQNASRRGTGR